MLYRRRARLKMRDVLESKEVITRKPHNCWGCTQKFPSKTKMKYHKEVDEGEFIISYWCDKCIEIMNRDFRFDDEFEYGELRDENN